MIIDSVEIRFRLFLVKYPFFNYYYHHRFFCSWVPVSVDTILFLAGIRLFWIFQIYQLPYLRTNCRLHNACHMQTDVTTVTGDRVTFLNKSVRLGDWQWVGKNRSQIFVSLSLCKVESCFQKGGHPWRKTPAQANDLSGLFNFLSVCFSFDLFEFRASITEGKVKG